MAGTTLLRSWWPGTQNTTKLYFWNWPDQKGIDQDRIWWFLLMLVYRIVKENYSKNIHSTSGLRNRWNDDGQFVIYTAESRSLACLENLVHRSQSGFNHIFKTMVISIPDDLKIITIELDELPQNWRGSYCEMCLEKVSQWYSQNQSPVLKVPSSIIPEEWNYVLNTRHPDYNKIKLSRIEDFLFDSRLW